VTRILSFAATMTTVAVATALMSSPAAFASAGPEQQTTCVVGQEDGQFPYIVPPPAGLSAGEGVGDEDKDPLVDFIGDVVTDAVATEGEAGAGWVLNLILGGDGNQTPPPQDAELIADLEAQRTQIANVQLSINELAASLQQDFNALEEQEAKVAFVAATASVNATVTDILTWSEQVCTWGYQARPWVPDAAAETTIGNIRAQALGHLNALSGALIGTSDGGGDSTGILGTWSDLWWAANAPEADRTIYTPDYVDSMNSLARWYLWVAAQLLNVHAEATHWNTATNPAGNPEDIEQVYDQLTQSVDTWLGSDPYNWPDLSAGTAIDTRTSPATMWTVSPVSLQGTDSSQYCLYASAICHLTKVDVLGDVLSTRIVPSVVDVQQHVGWQYPGWSIPTQAQWAAFVAEPSTPSGGTLQRGVNAWAQANLLPFLQAQTVTTPVGPGESVIPVLAQDLGSSVLDWNVNPTAAGGGATVTAVVRQPDPGPSRSASLAGTLALTTTISPVQPPFAETVETPTETPARTVTLPASEPESAPRTEAASSAVTGVLGQATTFTAVGACEQAYSQPAGANAVNVTVVGAAGGSSNGAGGQGGHVATTIPLRTGGILYVQVGGAGGNVTSDQSGDTFAGTAGAGGGGRGGGRSLDGAAYGTSGAGGGGLSGVAFDSACSQWVVIAGGGGGGGGAGGGAVVFGDGTGGSGGNSCLPSGGCRGTDGPSDGSRTSGSAGDLITPGAGGQTGADGSAGGLFLAGDGGTPPGRVDIEGAGGGGGGGGFGTGGGGGGGQSGAAGGGGGGGASWAADGLNAASFAIATGPAQVVITPVVAPEYTIGIETQGDLGTVGVLDNDSFGAPPGNPVLRYTANGNVTQSWGLVSDASDPRSVRIANPAANGCVSADPDYADAATPLPVTLGLCPTPGADATLTTWTFNAKNALGMYEVNNAATSLDGPEQAQTQTILSGWIAPAGLDTDTWGVQLAPDSIWGEATSVNPLTAVPAEEGEPAPTPGPRPDPVPNTPANPVPGTAGDTSGGSGNASARGASLPATGFEAAAMTPISFGAAVLLLLGGKLLWAARRRARHRDEADSEA
jgi:hypothetical protein